MGPLGSLFGILRSLAGQWALAMNQVGSRTGPFVSYNVQAGLALCFGGR